MSLKKFLIIIISAFIIAITTNILWNKNKSNDSIEIKQNISLNKEIPKIDKKDIIAATKNIRTSDTEKNVLVNKDMIPSSMEQATDEKSFLEKKLIDENAVSRLNANILSLAERERYLVIYKRLSLLDKYILESKIKAISNNLKEIEDHHEERLRQFGIVH